MLLFESSFTKPGHAKWRNPIRLKHAAVCLLLLSAVVVVVVVVQNHDDGRDAMLPSQDRRRASTGDEDSDFAVSDSGDLYDPRSSWRKRRAPCAPPGTPPVSVGDDSSGDDDRPGNDRPDDEDALSVTARDGVSRPASPTETTRGNNKKTTGAEDLLRAKAEAADSQSSKLYKLRGSDGGDRRRRGLVVRDEDENKEEEDDDIAGCEEEPYDDETTMTTTKTTGDTNGNGDWEDPMNEDDLSPYGSSKNYITIVGIGSVMLLFFFMKVMVSGDEQRAVI